MALARIARNGLRRSESTFSMHSNQKNTYSLGASTDKSFIQSLNTATTNGYVKNLPHIARVNHMNFLSRGISVTPQRQFPSAERIVEESDLECDDPSFWPGLEATKPGEKPRVVVLGTGWAACRFLKGLDTKVYDVVCISPRNHMVAEREGKYLVELFNRIGEQNGGKASSAKNIPLGDPFVYKHLGSMASVGGYKALVDLRQTKDARGISHAGFVSWFIWRSAYLTRVISWRNRVYVAVNWATTLVFGRDNSRIG